MLLGDSNRLDLELLARNFVTSREKAKALIKAEKVSLNKKICMKPSVLVSSRDEIEVDISPVRYVSRAGLKLEGALDLLKISVSDRVCFDIGASTGGFTDCLLHRGAKKVYCVDVGRGQLHTKIKSQKRVQFWEETNICDFDQRLIDQNVDLFVVDVSFVSILKILPAIDRLMARESYLLALMKPQFEVGTSGLSRRGIVKSDELALQVVDKIKNQLSSAKYLVHNVIESCLRGKEGNKEYFIYAQKLQ